MNSRSTKCFNDKHSFVRLFGLANKVVIFDEVHTYDSYTGTILNSLIRLLSQLDCTIIILSATLSNAAKRMLLGASVSSSIPNNYPQIVKASIKVLAAANCTVCWVGEDSLLFYSAGQSPTADTRNFRKQMNLASSKKTRLEAARRMFAKRFPSVDLKETTLSDLMGMEGKRIKQLYEEKALRCQVGWAGRSYTPGKFVLSDLTNKIITASNSALYAIALSAVYSLCYSPHIGFVHSGGPLPFVYDIADLYKENACIDLAFEITKELAGEYNRYYVSNMFRKRIISLGVLENISKDIEKVLGE